MGRPRKPTVLKVAAGTHRADRDHGATAPDSIELPKCPGWITGYGRHLWTTLGPQLVEMKLMSPAYAHAFTLLCRAYHDWRKATELIDKYGIFAEPPTADEDSGETYLPAKPNAAVAVRDKAFQQLTKCMTFFGLHPSAISGVTPLESASQKDPMAQLMG